MKSDGGKSGENERGKVMTPFVKFLIAVGVGLVVFTVVIYVGNWLVREDQD